jgi:hypothetical protein
VYCDIQKRYKSNLNASGQTPKEFKEKMFISVKLNGLEVQQTVMSKTNQL